LTTKAAAKDFHPAANAEAAAAAAAGGHFSRSVYLNVEREDFFHSGRWGQRSKFAQKIRTKTKVK